MSIELAKGDRLGARQQRAGIAGSDGRCTINPQTRGAGARWLPQNGKQAVRDAGRNRHGDVDRLHRDGGRCRSAGSTSMRSWR